MTKREGYFTVPELAKILRISRIAVYQRIKSGKIKAKKSGKNYVIDAQEAGIHTTDVLSERLKKEIERSVAKVIREYGETLKLLGRE